MKYLIIILLILLILNACVLWLLLMVTLIKRLSRILLAKNDGADAKKARRATLEPGEDCSQPAVDNAPQKP